MTGTQTATWVIAALATGGVIIRPWGLPEAIWAVLGAAALVVFSLLPWADAMTAIGRGLDVYLFLAGMMLLAELAREEGLFDWLAALAARQAKGSASRLFALIYIVGIAVTALLSNDATAVVLTPAVYAAAKAAKAEPLPYLLICAFIANAASFVLPISNPANLVIYGNHMPTLGVWLWQFGVPSLISIAATFVALRLTQRAHASRGDRQGDHGFTAVGGRKIDGLRHRPDGGRAVDGVRPRPETWRTDLLRGRADGCGHLAVEMASALERSSRHLLESTAARRRAFHHRRRARSYRRDQPLEPGAERGGRGVAGCTAWGAGVMIAIASNLMNNLPAGLIAGSAITAAPTPSVVVGAVLIGVDLGPNLSVTGSLATILWLVAMRREGEAVTARRFLGLGLIVMPPALILALGTFILMQLR